MHEQRVQGKPGNSGCAYTNTCCDTYSTTARVQCTAAPIRAMFSLPFDLHEAFAHFRQGVGQPRQHRLEHICWSFFPSPSHLSMLHSFRDKLDFYKEQEVLKLQVQLEEQVRARPCGPTVPCSATGAVTPCRRKLRSVVQLQLTKQLNHE